MYGSLAMKNILFILLSVLSIQLNAQIKIQGTVTDDQGILPGAVVLLKNSNYTDITTQAGSFELVVDEPGNYVLEVRYVGYQTHLENIILSERDVELENILLKPDVLGLNSVVVSANRYETDRKEAPVEVGVIGSKLLNATQSYNLADGLNFQPGIRVETNCQNCGFTQVRLNGLEGPYTQILVNSRPLFSSLIGVYGLEMIPTYMIEKVEVVKSGGSALYGSNAIAGTVNIITKEPVLNTWEVRSNYASIGGDANDWNNSINGSYVSNDLNFGISGFATQRNRNAFDANGDGFTEMVSLDATTFGIKTFYKFSPKTKLSLDFNYIDEFRRGGNALDLRPELTDITEQLEHEIFMASVNLDQYIGNSDKVSVYGSIQDTRRDSYYGGLGGGRTLADSLLARNAYGVTDDISIVTGAQWTNTAAVDHVFTSGIEWQHNRTEDAIPGYNRLIDQEVSNLGLYTQWEWEVNNKLKLLSGLRYDQSQVDGIYQLGQFERNIDNDFGVVSPRFTMLYKLNDNLQFRGGYARGFRAPQAFNEDLHIASAGGEPVFVLLSDALEKETSDAFTGSLSYTKIEGSSQFEFNVQGFYTQLNNPFVLVNTGSQLPNGSIVEEVRNGNGAVVQGFNIELNYAPNTQLTFQSGLTLQRSEFLESQVLFEPENPTEGAIVESDRFMRMPNAYGFWNINYETNTDWQFSLSNVITGSMLVPEILQENGVLVLRESNAFWDTTIKVDHHFHIGDDLHLTLGGGVQNVFNSFQDDFQTGPTRDSDYVYGPARPRTYFISLKISNND